MTALQSPIQEYLEIKIYSLKILLTVIKDLQNYSKGLHSQIFNVVKPFFQQISRLYATFQLQNYQNKIASLTDYHQDYLEYSDIPDTLIEIQLFWSVQLLLNLPKNQLIDRDIVGGLFFCLYMNQYESQEFSNNPEILINEEEDEPTIRSTALMIFESLFCSKKFKKVTYDNLLDLWATNDQIHLSWQGCEAKYLIQETYFEDIHIITNDVNQTLLQNLLMQNDGISNDIVSGRKLNIYIKALQTNYNYNIDPQLVNQILSQIISYIQTAKSIGAGLIGYKNLTRQINPRLQNCIIYISKNDCFNSQNQLLIEQLNLNSIITELFKIVDAVNLHILLDSTFHLLKIFGIKLQLDQFMVSQIIKWSSIYSNDTMICRIVNDIIEHFSLYPQGWDLLHTSISQFDGTLWLFIMRQLVQNANTTNQKTCIGQKLQDLINWMINPKNFDCDLMPQATILLRNFIEQFAFDLQTSALKDQILLINLKLLQTYDDDSAEAATSQCASLLFVSWHHILRNAYDRQLLELISNKLIHQNIPSNIEGLFIVFSLIIIFHEQQGTEFIQSQSPELLNLLLSKFVRFHSLFSQGCHINIFSQMICKMMICGNQSLKNQKYYDPILQTKAQTLSVKLIECMIDFYDKKQKFHTINDVVTFKNDGEEEQYLDDNENNEEWEDDEIERDQEINHMSSEINRLYQPLQLLSTQEVITKFFKSIVKNDNSFFDEQIKELNRPAYNKLYSRILKV